MGEMKKNVLRVGFDRSLKLEYSWFEGYERRRPAGLPGIG